MGSSSLVGSNINSVEQDFVIPNRMEGIAVGDKVYRNYDHKFTLQIDRSRTQRKIDAWAKVALSESGCELTLCDVEGVQVKMARTMELQPAEEWSAVEATICRQIQKSGGTIFSIKGVGVSGGRYFVPMSMLNELRREALEALRRVRVERVLPQNIIPDNGSARYPHEVVSRYENVTNRMAEEFYRVHGVEQIESPLEAMSTRGERVMISSYCLRREIGQCLKEKPTLMGDLYIEHGLARYKLCFDCKRCLMMLEDCTLSKENE